MSSFVSIAHIIGRSSARNPTTRNLNTCLYMKERPSHYSFREWYNVTNEIAKCYFSRGADDTFEIDGVQFAGDAVRLIYSYLRENPSKPLITWLTDRHEGI